MMGFFQEKRRLSLTYGVVEGTLLPKTLAFCNDPSLLLLH